MKNYKEVSYNELAKKELEQWKKDILKKPSIFDKASKGIQNKFNGVLPDKYHEIMTSSIKGMTKTVLFGYKYATKPPIRNISLEERENLVDEKAKNYKTTAMIEGAGTGAGGIFLGLSDFPLLLSIKIKFLYDVASIYGYDIKDYRERIYILSILQLAFSSQSNINTTFKLMSNWDEYIKNLPNDINDFDWRTFQQEYRDYLDLAKFLQLMPGIGAFVGFYVNGKLIDKLHETAVFAYRLRIRELN
ncbi:EcsC family protein [Clostridioides difficile]|nr:EcsC family protein [Clostridioides difficile]MDB0441250.1 ABC transporter-associated protein EcsC [Clostridioides difficile]